MIARLSDGEDGEDDIEVESNDRGEPRVAEYGESEKEAELSLNAI